MFYLRCTCIKVNGIVILKFRKRFKCISAEARISEIKPLAESSDYTVFEKKNSSENVEAIIQYK